VPLYSNPKASGIWYDVFSDGSASHPYPEDSLGAAAPRVFGTEEHEAKRQRPRWLCAGVVAEEDLSVPGEGKSRQAAATTIDPKSHRGQALNFFDIYGIWVSP